MIDIPKAVHREHRREDYITKSARASYEPGAPAPVFHAFLERVMPDADLRRYLQRCMGYCMTGYTSEQVLFFWIGSGRNGKSTMLDIMRYILGSYAMQAKVDAVQSMDNSNASGEFIASLHGVRLVTVTEPNAGKALATALLKYLTGEVVLRGRHLYQESFEFTNQAKVVLSSNHDLTVADDSDGMWRRIQRLRWPVQIPEDEVDTTLPEKLKAEMNGIFMWMIEGAEMWAAEGLNPPAAVRKETSEYREQQDTWSQYFTDCVDEDLNGKESITALYNRYLRWCKSQRAIADTKSTMVSRFEEHGFPKRKSHGAWYIYGVKERVAEFSS